MHVTHAQQITTRNQNSCLYILHGIPTVINYVLKFHLPKGNFDSPRVSKNLFLKGNFLYSVARKILSLYWVALVIELMKPK